jgi:hypothetical protein
MRTDETGRVDVMSKVYLVESDGSVYEKDENGYLLLTHPPSFVTRAWLRTCKSHSESPTLSHRIDQWLHDLLFPWCGARNRSNTSSATTKGASD